MSIKKKFSLLLIAQILLFSSVNAMPLLVNGDFSSGLTNWTTLNSGDGDDTVVVWIINDPSGVNQLSNNGSSRGPASRVIYQDFTVPSLGVSNAQFNFDYFATNLSALGSDLFTTFINQPFSGNGNNGTRIDILDPSSDVITGAVLFSIFAPTDASPVGTPTSLVSNSFVDTSALTSFLNSNAGSTLRLRIGNREEDFPWDTGFDNLNLDVTANAAIIPTFNQWGLIVLFLMILSLSYHFTIRNKSV